MRRLHSPAPILRQSALQPAVESSVAVHPRHVHGLRVAAADVARLPLEELYSYIANPGGYPIDEPSRDEVELRVNVAEASDFGAHPRDWRELNAAVLDVHADGAVVGFNVAGVRG